MSGVAPSIQSPTMGTDPLSGLRDWHLPGPVSWWPPAPGWWVLAALVLSLVVAVLLWWRRRRRRTAPARAALAELVALRARLATAEDGRGFAAAVSVLLRRLALVRYPRDQVAGLAGAQWPAFLERTGGGSGFTQGPGRILAAWPYLPAAHENPGPDGVGAAGSDLVGLVDLADRWIRANWEPRP